MTVKPIYAPANAQAEAAKTLETQGRRSGADTPAIARAASTEWDKASMMYLEAEANDAEGTPSFMMPQSDVCARQAIRCLEEAGLHGEAQALRDRYTAEAA